MAGLTALRYFAGGGVGVGAVDGVGGELGAGFGAAAGGGGAGVPLITEFADRPRAFAR